MTPTSRRSLRWLPALAAGALLLVLLSQKPWRSDRSRSHGSHEKNSPSGQSSTGRESGNPDGERRRKREYGDFEGTPLVRGKQEPNREEKRPALSKAAAQTTADLGELAVFSRSECASVPFPRLPWQPGERWLVETHYRTLQHAGSPSIPEKSILWVYQVRGVEDLDGRPAFAVEVSPLDASDMPFPPGGTLYISTDTHEVWAVRDRIQEAGEIRDRWWRFEDAERGALTVLFPTELPALGDETLARRASNGALPPDPFRKDPPVAAELPRGDVLDVAFEVNGTMVRQRWDLENPVWPLYSRTPARVSYYRGKG